MAVFSAQWYRRRVFVECVIPLSDMTEGFLFCADLTKKGLSMMNQKVLRLTEGALLVATATLLSLIGLFRMPQGGEVTLCATLPLALIGYRHGVKFGLLASFVYAVIQLFLGLGNVSYAANIGVALVIVLFDYLVPYTLFGLCGLFGKGIKTRKSQTVSLALSLIVCTVMRYVCHVVSGYFVWSEWADGEWLTALCGALGVPAQSSLYFLLYSLGYNSFVFVDMAIALMVLVALSLVLNISGAGLPRVWRKEG